jgi:hypothetical protein
MSHEEMPAGFVPFTVGRARAVCAAHVADAVRQALAGGTLYEYAQRHPKSRTLRGRGDVYAVPLPGDAEQVVVRHNHHGGFFAPVTRDLFRPPTRAPRELMLSQRLHHYGVATPHMLGYVIYRAPLGFVRADVTTREVPNSFDLSVAITSSDVDFRARAIGAVSDLLLTLGAVGAHHADLNVKNILLHESGASLEAMVLDIDCVRFDEPKIVLELNLERLLRSARKWQTLHGATVTDDELGELAGSVRERRPPRRPLSTSS